jgi:hypothetical protein
MVGSYLGPASVPATVLDVAMGLIPMVVGCIVWVLSALLARLVELEVIIPLSSPGLPYLLWLVIVG